MKRKDNNNGVCGPSIIQDPAESSACSLGLPWPASPCRARSAQRGRASFLSRYVSTEIVFFFCDWRPKLSSRLAGSPFAEATLPHFHHSVRRPANPKTAQITGAQHSSAAAAETAGLERRSTTRPVVEALALTATCGGRPAAPFRTSWAACCHPARSQRCLLRTTTVRTRTT
jgi:hypothetical protein